MDLFNSYILSKVEIILHCEPDFESLHQILKISSPQLTLDEVLIESKRKKAYRILLAKVHPDKNLQKDSATNLFQEVQLFYKIACSKLPMMQEVDSEKIIYDRDINKKNSDDHTSSKENNQRSANMRHEKTSPFGSDRNKKNSQSHFQHKTHRFRESTRKSSTPCGAKVAATDSMSQEGQSVKQPSNFHVSEKWHYITYGHKATSQSAIGTKYLLHNVVSQCINARGSIAHGRKPTQLFQWWNDVSFLQRDSIEDMLSQYGGAYKLSNITSIKEELMTRGPVISLSFRPTKEFLNSYKNPNKSYSMTHKTLPVLILGWKSTEKDGECWVIHPFDVYNIDEAILIPCGQMELDHECVVPKGNFLDMCWQSGAYFDINLTKSPGWRFVDDVEIMLKSKELEMLGKCIGEKGFSSASNQSSTFILRDAKRIAHSRECEITNLAWNDSTNLWKVKIHFIK